MIKLIFSVLWVILKSYRQQKFRLFIVLFAVILGGAGFTSVLVINETAKQSYRNGNQPLIGNVRYAIYPKHAATISKSDYANLRRSGNSNIVAVSIHEEEIEGNSLLNFMGIDYYAMMSISTDTLKTEGSESKLSLLSAETKFILHNNYAKILHTNDVLTDQNYLKLQSGLLLGPISSIDAIGMGNQILSDIETLFNQFNVETISYILVVDKFADEQPPDIQLPAHLRLVSLNTGESAEQLTSSFHLNLFAMGLLMFVVCMFVVLNALNLLMMKRMPMFKTLRQLGIPRASIFMASIIEMLLLAIVCSAMGVTLGIELATWLTPAVNQTLESLYDVTVSFERLSWLTLYAQVLLASIIGLGFAAISPMRMVNQQLSTIKTGSANASSALKWLTLASILMMISGLLFLNYTNLTASFVIISLLIISGCLLVLVILPNLLKLFLHLVPKTLPTLRWSVADANRVSNKSNIAFCAFFIAVATNVGMNLMVNSFRVATDSWVTQRLTADAYIYTQVGDTVRNLITKEFPTLTAFTRQSEIGYYQKNSIQLRTYPSDIRHQNAIQFAQTHDNLWLSFSQAKGVLINQQFALSMKVDVGQQIVITRQDQRQLSMQVVGIYYDYGNPRPQALMTESLIEKLSKDSINDQNIIAVFAQSGQRSVLSLLKAKLALQIPNAEMMKTAELLKVSMQTFDRTFVVTQSLNIITLLVAAFSLAASLTVIDLDNKPQRALIRTLGVPASRVLWVMLFQYSVLCLLICAIAVPFGVLLSWLLIHLVNVQAFFWSYPLVIELSSILKIVLSSLAVVLLVVILSASKATLSSPIEDIKWLNG